MCAINDFLRVAVFSANIVSYHSYVNYEMFKGFDSVNNNIRVSDNATSANTEQTTKATNLTTPLFGNYSKLLPKKSTVKLKQFKKSCPETDFPISLGTYEIPTHRDLVLFTTRILLKMFNSYHEKTLFLLKDIKEVTTATSEYEKKCLPQNRKSYKQCVKRVSKKCVSIVKDLVASKEAQKLAVAPLLEGTTCNMTTMEFDPIQLIKILAMDEASLEFALPAFLNLIGGCSSHCSRQLKDGRIIRRPLRHMTDQDLVVRHFLTNKNYTQLIMDPILYV